MGIIYKNGIAYGNQPSIDATLTHQGEAADAKAVGDAVSELRNTLYSQTDVYNELLNPSVYGSKNSITGAAWTYVTVLDNIFFKTGKRYRLTVTVSETQDANWYINVYKKDGTRIIGPTTVSGNVLTNTITTGVTESDLEGIYIQVGLPKSNIYVHAEYSGVGDDAITKLTEDISEVGDKLEEEVSYVQNQNYIYNELLNPSVYSANDVITGAAWTYVTVLDNIFFKTGKRYKLTVTVSETQDANWYINVYKKDGTRIIGPTTVSGTALTNVITTGVTETDLSGIYMQVGLPKSNISVHAEYCGTGEDIVMADNKRFTEQPDYNLLLNSNRYIYHFGMDAVGNASIPVIVPSQSVFDISIAKRLGFSIMEFNVQKTATSGKYVVSHGISGKLGYDMTDLNGDNVGNTITFQSISFDDLITNYRYRSTVSKYRTPITSLEDALIECRKYNMIPLISLPDEDSLEIARGICGSNFVAYNASRESFKGVISTFKTTQSADSVKSDIDAYGKPYFYGLDSPLVNFPNEATRKEILSYAHMNGCYINHAYQGIIQLCRLIDEGFDGGGSTDMFVDPFFEGTSYIGEEDFSSFDTNGTVQDSVLLLANNEYVGIDINDTAFLSKGCLVINFIGDIYIENPFDMTSQYTLHSDGKKSIVLACGGIKKNMSLKIVSAGNTSVNMLCYYTKQC